MMKRDPATIVRIAVVSILAIALIGKVGVTLYNEHDRIQKLRESDCYELYFSYVWVRDAYYAYIMINDERIEPQHAASILTDARIFDYNERRSLSGYGDYPIVVHLISPSEELPYGWQKSEENISANFDTSVFHRNAVCTVTIPMEADSLSDCVVEYR